MAHFRLGRKMSRVNFVGDRMLGREGPGIRKEDDRRGPAAVEGKPVARSRPPLHPRWSRWPMSRTALLLLLASAAPLAADGLLASGPAVRAPAKAPIKAFAFDLKDVRLLDGPFKEAMERNRKVLLVLDADRLLHTFRLNAGLPSTAQPYGGWEAPGCELRGHSLGHYLSACALAWAGAGDEALKARADYIVEALAACQAALPGKGFNPGYLSAYPESFIDRVVAGKPVWAPWYTLHKIYAGLIDVHVHCGSAKALEMAKGMAAWAKGRLDALDDEGVQKMLRNEFGGMNEALANLHGVTGDPAHLATARRFDHRQVFDPLARGEDRLNGFHANTQIPKWIGAAREFELTGEARYRDIARFAWERVALHRSYVIGGHSDHEHFFPVEQFPLHLGTDTAETCNTYNMLKLTRHLFAWEPSAETMDFTERALINHILASQDPVTGQYVYLMSLKPGHFKTYSTPEHSFWCCVGTGMENHARYGESIYFHDDASLYVNLFIASELAWKAKGLTVRQETTVPDADVARLAMRCAAPVRLALRIRRPAWAGAGFGVTVNGVPVDADGKPGSYVAIEREWKDGDRVEVRLPMALRAEALPGDPSIVAICYGPVVLAGELGAEGVPSPYARGQTDLNRTPSPEAPAFLADLPDVLAHIEPVPGKPLTFRTRGLGRPRDVTLVPFHRLHHQRYTVYWKVFTEEAWKRKEAERAAEEERRRALEKRLVDAVRPGEQQPETDHAMKGERTESGEHLGRKWRHATDGGWFSYEMKVLPDVPMTLRCTYWGDDGGRTFDVQVDGRTVATQKLERTRPGAFFDVDTAIPEELTKRKEKVTVRFQGQAGSTAGGVFGCAILKP
jgi:hypothetical protein